MNSNRIEKFTLTILLAILLLISFSPAIHAQGILPSGVGKEGLSCSDISEEGQRALQTREGFADLVKEATKVGIGRSDAFRQILGCAVRSGKIKLYMIPYFVTYLVQFLLSIAGIIAVLFVVYGGFQYVKGGVTEDKESGKKTITHALIGLVVSLSAWIIVNFIQVALTS